MKVVVLGASGFLGYACVESLLLRKHNVIAIHGTLNPQFDSPVISHKMNLAELDKLRMFLLHEFPDVIINAAAISDISAVAKDTSKSTLINVELPRQVAELAHHLGSRFIHVSTDMVFDGKQGSYRSTDMPNPLNLYGEQKLLAEKAVLAASDASIVLRTVLLSGNSLRGDRSLHERLFASWQNGERPKLFTDEFRTPCTNTNLAEVITELCERNTLSGIFHWGGKEKLSRYDMGKAILEFFNLPSDFIQAAKTEDASLGNDRPKDLSFISEPLVGKLKTAQQSFSEQLEECFIPLPARDWYHAL